MKTTISFMQGDSFGDLCRAIEGSGIHDPDSHILYSFEYERKEDGKWHVKLVYVSEAAACD